jgi:NTE family protein
MDKIFGMTDITLALGGGGAKGNSHIGVIRRLEQNGFQIRGIAGTSFGGLVAVLYAAGYTPDEIEEMFAGLDQNKLYGHEPEDGPSLMGFAGATRFLQGVLGDRTFEDLRIPCVVTAADLKSGTEVVLSTGSVVDALQATTAVPVVFPVRYLGEFELVDGGTLDPVPVAPARALFPKLPVVAVALSMPMGTAARTWALPMPSFIPQMITQRLSSMRYGQMLDIFVRSFDLLSRAVAEYRLEMDRPDVIIRPQVGNIELLDVIDVHEVALIGEAAVDEVLPEMREKFSLRGRLMRALGAKV